MFKQPHHHPIRRKYNLLSRKLLGIISAITVLKHASSLDAVRALLDQGADPNIIASDGESLLAVDIQNNAGKHVPLLLEYGVNTNYQHRNSGCTALHNAAQFDDIPTAKALLKDSKTNIYLQDQGGNTALHIAADNNNLELAELLLVAGANPHIPNNYHQTPIDLAKTYDPHSPDKPIFMNPMVELLDKPCWHTEPSPAVNTTALSL